MTSISPIAIHQASKSVLDVGTGTGDWAIEFAKRNLSSWVIGTDLSVIQCKLTSPLKCELKIEDAEVDWINCELFDLIHPRILCLGIHHWPHYLRWCFDNLKPGGWFEEQLLQVPLISTDGSAEPKSALFRWADLLM